MTWLSSLFISFLTGVLGLFCGGLIMQLCVGWYSVSSFEGKSGYAVVAVALLGCLVGAVIGLVVARFFAGSADPGFLKGLGFAVGAVAVLTLVVLALCRLAADIPPEMNGQPLELVIEIRTPKGFTVPTEPDEYGATAEIYLARQGRLPAAPLRLQEAVLNGGHWIVPATVPLTTRSSDKFLSVRFSKDTSLIFNLPLRSNPKKGDLEWSPWIESGWEAGEPEPAKEAKFNARYRVRPVEPEPPAPDLAAIEAERFAALDPNAPLPHWLEFFGPDKPMERNNAVAEVVARRQPELVTLVNSADESVREKALLATQYLSSPTRELGEAVLAEGRAIAEALRASNTLLADDPALAPTLSTLSTRFNHWKRSWWIVHQRLGVDGRPIYLEIHQLALVRPRGTAADEIEVNARVILEQLEK